MGIVLAFLLQVPTLAWACLLAGNEMNYQMLTTS